MKFENQLHEMLYNDLSEVILNENNHQGIPQEVQRETQSMMKNGLESALGLQDGLGLGNPANFSVQLSQVTTLFKNNRWYLVSNMRQLLSEIYVEHGLVQTIVDVPVDDGLRGGVKIKSEQLSEEQIRDLEISLDRDDDLNTIGQAVKWNRLYGGAGILVMTDQDPVEPLDLEAITKDSPLEFRAVDMWELFWDKQNTEGYDPTIQEHGFEFYNYYAKKVHKSRVMRLKGLTAPSFLRPRLRGWGFSVVETLVRSINQYLKANDLGFEVLDEFKLDVFKIKNLTTTLLSPLGEQQIQKRVALANRQKNYQNALVMDSEDDFDHKQLSFAGLAEAMEGIRKQVASDMRIPMTKLFGQSAAGFNSGEDDIEVYNSMVESQVRNKIKYDILRVLEIKCQKLFSFIPDDLEIEFQPLRMLNSEQQENVKTQKFNRVLAARTANEISTLEFREMVNHDDLLPIKLETDHLQITEDTAMEGEQSSQSDTFNPGANREDTRKPKITQEYGGTKEEPGPDKEVSDPYIQNSIEYDKAAYEVDGGDSQYPEYRKELLMNPGKVDETLWKKAKDASMKAFGKEKWQFVTWWYKKNGGKFGGA